jgi:hypothetical protein
MSSLASGAAWKALTVRADSIPSYRTLCTSAACRALCQRHSTAGMLRLRQPAWAAHAGGGVRRQRTASR